MKKEARQLNPVKNTFIAKFALLMCSIMNHQNGQVITTKIPVSELFKISLSESPMYQAIYPVEPIPDHLFGGIPMNVIQHMLEASALIMSKHGEHHTIVGNRHVYQLAAYAYLKKPSGGWNIKVTTFPDLPDDLTLASVLHDLTQYREFERTLPVRRAVIITAAFSKFSSLIKQSYGVDSLTELLRIFRVSKATANRIKGLSMQDALTMCGGYRPRGNRRKGVLND